MSALHLLDGATVERYIHEDPQLVLNVVEAAYKAHWLRDSVCPQSVFLRFPDGNRIIGLPAYLHDETMSAAGMKWISSFPRNLASGLRRASGVIVLNSVDTGFATAIMEGGAISAARTGAFAGIACRALLQGCARPTLAIIGCGPIALTTLSYLKLLTDPAELRLFDLVEDRAEAFASDLGSAPDRVRKVGSLAEALDGADVALFATTASQPYLEDPALLADCKVVLHVSLRDISEDVLAQCFNVSDDRDHVVREETSLHRLSRLQANGSPVDAELGDVLWGGAALPVDKRIVFSPFGLGVLDIALANHILVRALAEQTTTPIPNFYNLAN